MKIGIIGSGDVAHALGTGFVALGHEVKMGSRDPAKQEIAEWVSKQGKLASSGTLAEAAAFGEIVVVATHGETAENAIKLADPKNFSGKVVIDTTNPLSKDMPPKLFVGHTDSLGERIQRWLPDAKVVKAFNIVGNAHMFKPDFPNGPPDMFICGNEAKAKETVTKIANSFGWPSVIDLGNIDAARLLEPLALTWIIQGFRTNQWNMAWRLLKK